MSTENIRSARENGEPTVLTLLDIGNAFNTVDVYYAFLIYLQLRLTGFTHNTVSYW